MVPVINWRMRRAQRDAKHFESTRLSHCRRACLIARPPISVSAQSVGCFDTYGIFPCMSIIVMRLLVLSLLRAAASGAMPHRYHADLRARL